MRISSLISLQGMERSHWEMHSTGSFYGTRPASNLLETQRLPWIPVLHPIVIMMIASLSETSLSTVSAWAMGQEYSNSASTGKRKEKDVIPPTTWTHKQEAENGRKENRP
jgi:hypothetical protein